MNEAKLDNIFLQIFTENWDHFKRRHPVYSTRYYDDIVSKMLGCGDPFIGHSVFMCTHCGGDRKIVAFTCKSKLCLKCGRVFSENFVHGVKDRLHPGVTYRHLILTIPEQLRDYFHRSRHNSDLFNKFYKAGLDCIKALLRKKTRKDLECGCLEIIHMTGRKGNINAHLHILVMDGGYDKKEKKWYRLGYFRYEWMHIIWQDTLLKMIEDHTDDPKILDLTKELKRLYPKGFVANIKKGKVPKRSGKIIKYLAKYLFRPSISLKRIKSYNRKTGEVVYEYQSHITKRAEKEKVHVFTFIGRMMQQILPKGFQRVRYYGLQATKHLERSKAILQEAINKESKDEQEGKRNESDDQIKMTFSDRVKRWWGKDPLECSRCGKKMELVKVWSQKNGVIFDLFSWMFGRQGLSPG